MPHWALAAWVCDPTIGGLAWPKGAGVQGLSRRARDLLAGHETGVLILNTVLTADRSTGNAVAGAAATVLAKSGAFALKTAVVVVFLTLSAADGSDS